MYHRTTTALEYSCVVPARRTRSRGARRMYSTCTALRLQHNVNGKGVFFKRTEHGMGAWLQFSARAASEHSCRTSPSEPPRAPCTPTLDNIRLPAVQFVLCLWRVMPSWSTVRSAVIGRGYAHSSSAVISPLMGTSSRSTEGPAMSETTLRCAAN